MIFLEIFFEIKKKKYTCDRSIRLPVLWSLMLTQYILCTHTPIRRMTKPQMHTTWPNSSGVKGSYFCDQIFGLQMFFPILLLPAPPHPQPLFLFTFQITSCLLRFHFLFSEMHFLSLITPCPFSHHVPVIWMNEPSVSLLSWSAVTSYTYYRMNHKEMTCGVEQWGGQLIFFQACCSKECLHW